jgi:ferredoxin-NADP reductase
MSFNCKILKTDYVTHDVKRFILEKPKGFQFTPGQATEMSINLAEWKDKKRPFTFTALNDDQVLEFIIKGYYDHQGVTNKLHQLNPGDELIIRKPWGTINYQGPGVFIAGGAGVTPFIAILRQLRKENKIKDNTFIFSNKTEKDVILEKEFKQMFKDGGKLILTLTEEKNPCYESGRVDKDFLEEKVDDFNQNFYVCGPPAMVKDLKQILKDLGANMDEIVFEK